MSAKRGVRKPKLDDRGFFEAAPHEDCHGLGGLQSFMNENGQALFPNEMEFSSSNARNVENATGDGLGEDIDGVHSVRLLALLQKLDSALERLNAAKLELHSRTLYSHTADLTAIDKLNQQLEAVTDLSHHLKVILDHRSGIISRLQQPWSGDFLVVEEDQQGEFVSLLEEAAENLKRFPELLNALQEARQFTTDVTELDAIISPIPRLLAKYQRYLESLGSLRQVEHRQLKNEFPSL